MPHYKYTLAYKSLGEREIIWRRLCWHACQPASSKPTSAQMNGFIACCESAHTHIQSMEYSLVGRRDGNESHAASLRIWIGVCNYPVVNVCASAKRNGTQIVLESQCIALSLLFAFAPIVVESSKRDTYTNAHTHTHTQSLSWVMNRVNAVPADQQHQHCCRRRHHHHHHHHHYIGPINMPRTYLAGLVNRGTSVCVPLRPAGPIHCGALQRIALWQQLLLY